MNPFPIAPLCLLCMFFLRIWRKKNIVTLGDTFKKIFCYLLCTLLDVCIFQATAEQIRLAQMIYDKNDADFEDKVKQLMEVTGKNQDECIVALHDCNGDVNRAINILLEGISDTVEDVDLEEIAGRQFKFHHCCTWLSFKVHPSVIWVILTVIPLIWHIDTIDTMTHIGRLFSS
ncbi:uncharacterized protein ACIBXB_005933 isoform 1-T1 [Morphnus guianensis]